MKPTIRVVLALIMMSGFSVAAANPEPKPRSTWPQKYTVQRDDSAGTIALSTPFYTIEHDLRQGGAIRRITLRHGRAANLLVRPLETRVRDEGGAALTDLRDSAPLVTHRGSGLNEIVMVDSALMDARGHASGLRVKTTFEYRWGYIKIHKEILPPSGGVRLRELCPVSAVLAPTLTDYGYREGITEEEGAEPFSFGTNVWGKLRPDRPADPTLRTRYVPRSMIFVDPGVEGIEWFAGSDLSQWELQPAGRRGQGLCSLAPSQDPAGLALSISPLWSAETAMAVKNGCPFDFYLAVPLLEGHAYEPWIHTSFNRNRGNWVSPEEIRGWAEKGYQTVHCHNDGDYYGDGLFWRDGSYPPYSDMDRYDKVLEDCRRVGVRTATYFSNKELHPSTREFKEHGEEWGRKDSQGALRHTFYRKESEFGALMCLRSGWLEYLKLSIDRVLKNHPLDGVYFDWNVALYCKNPLHEGKGANEKAGGHWDMDELLDLMEWTRQRVGRDGLLIVHNTTVPMFVTENFADYVVATEWGYQKWTDRAPKLESLPLEWNLAGARPRGVISYGSIEKDAPRRLHRLFALEALLGGVAPWPASPETFDLLPLLKPLGDIESFRFADWRNTAVSLSERTCGAAVYSRPGEAYLLLANLDKAPREVTCALRPEKLPYPLAKLSEAALVAASPASAGEPPALDVRGLVSEGVKLNIPGDGAVFIRVK
ncbi:MAG: hypothetical protein A2W03_06525 [Candidatus Aminicenantes bacterium RBG_16_63_16]|nr:MAG: hypothetical protein A2W03_06525 [Candidatus Aminicenantes bacterium RBG_16_63_16]